MPVISSNDKVLVTGANGYIALWIVKTLLERGNTVRAAVRSEGKAGPLKELFKSYGAKLETVIVPDMTKEGAWDEAVKNVRAIEHTATPVDFSNPNPEPEDLIEPAIKGTLRVLESALKHKEGIKRIVVTSSMAAVAAFEDPPREPYTEQDWNESALKVVEEKGSQAGVQIIYSASKVLAERAAWDFYKKHRDQVSWDLTTICPPVVIGAPLGEVSSSSSLNESLKFYWAFVLESSATREQLSSSIPVVDVRDMAEAHVLALEKEKAGGERIIVLHGTYVWQDLLDVAKTVENPGRKLPVGFPDIDRKTTAFNVSSTKASEILGIKYHSIKDTTKHMFDDFTRRGF